MLTFLGEMESRNGGPAMHSDAPTALSQELKSESLHYFARTVGPEFWKNPFQTYNGQHIRTVT